MRWAYPSGYYTTYLGPFTICTSEARRKSKNGWSYSLAPNKRIRFRIKISTQMDLGIFFQLRYLEIWKFLINLSWPAVHPALRTFSLPDRMGGLLGPHYDVLLQVPVLCLPVVLAGPAHHQGSEDGQQNQSSSEVHCGVREAVQY